MAGEWTTAETRALLSVWGAADVQSQLDRVVRNKTIYEDSQGSSSSWIQSYVGAVSYESQEPCKAVSKGQYICIKS